MKAFVSKTQAEPLWPSPVAVGLFISNPSAVDIYISGDGEALNASASQNGGTPTVGTKVAASTTTPFQFSRYRGTLWALADSTMAGDAYLDVEPYGI